MEGELARSKARLPSLLLALLGLGPELLFGQARVQPRQVNGVLGGSVLLSPALPPNKTVKEIEWSFSAGAGATIQVAEFSPGGFERPDPKDRFKDRLEMFNETALKIGALERGDSGVYGARIKLHPALVEDQSFNLSVSEPLPDPRNPELAAFGEPRVVPPRAAVPRTRRDRGHRHLDESQGCFSSRASPRCGPFPIAGDGVRPSCWTAVAAVVPLATYAAALEFPEVPPWRRP